MQKNRHEVDITQKFSSDTLPGSRNRLVLRGKAGTPWDTLLPSGGSIILRTLADMVTSVAQISVTCNARNIELYNKGEYMGLTRGSLESDVLFVHNMDDYTSVNGIVTNEISFKFLSLKPVKSGPVLVDTFSIVVGPSQSAPSPPEPMPGSNSMAMLMMMMSAAKNGQSQTPALLPFRTKYIRLLQRKMNRCHYCWNRRKRRIRSTYLQLISQSLLRQL